MAVAARLEVYTKTIQSFNITETELTDKGRSALENKQ